MKVTDLVIVGAGGHGRECLEIATSMIEDGAPLRVQGFVDDSPSDSNRELVEELGFSILGGLDDYLRTYPRSVAICIGVGSPTARRVIGSRIQDAKVPSLPLAHPDCTIASHVELTPGAVIWPGARLSVNVSLGKHVHVNQNATVGHDSRLEDYVTINPQAAVSGNATISSAAMVGAGAKVLQGLSIGSTAVVGAGAVVVRDVDSGQVVKGVPAR